MLISFKELLVWQKSIKLVVEIYRITRCLPKEETYCLSSQMRRAAISAPSNIAEGYKRQGIGDYLKFLNIAESSLAELETQIIIAKKLYDYVDCKNAEYLLNEIQKMLFAMIKKLKLKNPIS